MKVLLTGAQGQLGCELTRLVPEDVELFPFTKKELDITDSTQVETVLTRILPDVVINAAAYTAVDAAEKNVETAYAVNRDGVANLAGTCKLINARLIHISTDYVFDGQKGEPYTVDDKPNPLNVYGKSKLAGELTIQAMMDNYIILRTSWVFSEFGNNFLKTIAKLLKEKDQLRVVDDQFGRPTWAYDIAFIIWKLIITDQKLKGVLHFTGNEIISWFGFAKRIEAYFRTTGTELGCRIDSEVTSLVGRPAVRPKEVDLGCTLNWMRVYRRNLDESIVGVLANDIGEG